MFYVCQGAIIPAYIIQVHSHVIATWLVHCKSVQGRGARTLSIIAQRLAQCFLGKAISQSTPLNADDIKSENISL